LFETYLLSSDKKSENKYAQRMKSSGVLSATIFRERPNIQIKFKDRMAACEIPTASLGKYKKEGQEGGTNTYIIVTSIPPGGCSCRCRSQFLAIRDFDYQNFDVISNQQIINY
jgi:hypothetical protein